MDKPLPVSAAIRLPTEPRLRLAAERVLAAVDRVHRVAGLPVIPLTTRRDDPRYRGQYHVRRSSGRPMGIGIDPTGPTPEFTLLHEIGHFIDHQVLGQRGIWASPDYPDLLAWRMAVEDSAHIGQLRDLGTLSDLDLVRATGNRNITQQREMVRYLLMYTETWARSYAQYVAGRGGEPVLLEQLVDERESGEIPWDLSQWTNDEFEPIATAIDRLFDRKGWRQ